MPLSESEARAALLEVLDRLGVRSGDRIMLGIDMGSLPLPSYEAALTRDAFRERERRWCSFVLQVLMDCLGPAGTLLVPAFSYSCTKPGSTFVAESTASEVGPFTEFVRSRPQAIRSLHPIFSLAGIGADAPSLLGECGRSAFGTMSPFGRFADYGISFLCLGVELRTCVTYVHHLEQTYGCPHRYNKSFNLPVIAGGRTLPGPWYAYLSYRGINYASDVSILQSALQTSGQLMEATWNGRPNQLADIAAVDRTGYDLLSRDPSAFVDRPLDFRFDDSASSTPGENMTTLVVQANTTASHG